MKTLCLRFMLALGAILTVFFSSGCATMESAKAKTLGPTGGTALPNLANYTTVTVVPFSSPAENPDAVGSGERLAEDVAARLKLDFPNLFQDVRLGQPSRQPNELIVNGAITKYQPGNRALRGIIGPGVGAASLEGQIVLNDAQSGRELMKAPFDKIWAWGGIWGANKGITGMMTEIAASIAATVSSGKKAQSAPTN